MSFAYLKGVDVHGIDFFTDYDSPEPIADLHKQKHNLVAFDDIEVTKPRVQDPIKEAVIDGYELEDSMPTFDNPPCGTSDLPFAGQNISKKRKSKIESMRKICNSCEYADQCLELGKLVVTADSPPYQMFGGLTAKEILVLYANNIG